MTATNVDVITTEPMSYRSREQFPCSSPFKPWVTYGVYTHVPVVWNIDKRPNNTSNPIREDGTRQPAPWERRVGELTFTRAGYSAIYERVTPFCQRIEYELVQGNLVGTSDVRGFMAKIHGSWLFGSGPFHGPTEGKARTAFLSKLANSQVEFGTMLGEMSQTLGLIQQFVDRSTKAVRRVRSMGRNLPSVILREIINFGRLPKRSSLPKWYQGKRRLALERAILREWLTFQFGVKPLVQGVADLVNAIDVLIGQEVIPDLWIRAGAAAREVYEYSGSDHNVLGPVGSFRLHGRGYTNYACHISGRYALSNHSLRTSQQWGVVNPVALAWELTPFSWMIDYLWNVSRWLNSFTAPLGLRFVEGSIGRLAKLDHNVCWVDDGGGPYHARAMAYEEAFTGGTCMRFSRQVLSLGIFPDIHPRWQPRLNATRVANALSALVLQIRLV